ncbi:MAG: AvaI/BsoBI family type II restriction endonuclease [Phycisphaerales bacterium]
MRLYLAKGVNTAVENAMAGEIWDMLRKGTLSNAANLTVDAQMASLSTWLCDL